MHWWANRHSHSLVAGMHTGKTHLEGNLKYLTKLPINVAIPLLGIYPKVNLLNTIKIPIDKYIACHCKNWKQLIFPYSGKWLPRLCYSSNSNKNEKDAPTDIP